MDEKNPNIMLPPERLAVVAERRQKSPWPDHLIPLPDGQWALWHWAGLRGPGFPAAPVLRLSTPECAAAADRLLQAEDEAQRAQDAALDAVNKALDMLRRNEEWDDLDTRNRLVRTMRRLKRGELPEPLGVASVEAPLASFRVACAQVDAARADFREALTGATARVSQAIREVAQTNSFREAIVWQNRHALHHAIAPLLRRPPGTHARGKEQRRREQLLATYLQRYCVRNDIIGFFGPDGWAKLVRQGEAVDVRPGPSLLTSRTVDFESWCIEALAATLSKDQALRPWIAPRRMPFIYLEGTTLYVPSHGPTNLPPGQAAVLQLCDGERVAKDIAMDLLQTPATGLQSEEEVYQILDHLGGSGLISWSFEIPVQPNADRILRRQLERIDDERRRRPALGTLNELEAARDAIARAAGAAEKLDEAMEDLEATFTRLTGMAPTRAAGTTVTGRTLMYEDSRRDVEATIGPELIESLGPALSLLLASARWLTFETARVYRKAFKELYSGLVEKIRSSTVDAVTFWHLAEPLLLDPKVRPFEMLPPMFRERWADVLSMASGQHRVAYTSEELRPRVLAAFDAPHAGWRTARYHSPDVLIDAPSVEAIRRGDYQLVLGEMHLAANPLMTSFFGEQPPSIEELSGYFERDLPEPRLVPVPPKDWPTLTTRSPLVLALPKDFLLAVFPDACGIPKAQAVSIGELVVEENESGLIVRTRDGRLQFDIIEAFANILAPLVLNCFKVLPPYPHTPRVTVDCLVIHREAWGFAPAEMPFAYQKTEADRFVAARRWARAHGMPRYAFVKAPVEIKPFYVDFDSPIYVEIFAKAVRRTGEANLPEPLITVTEMLPEHRALWLQDAEGQSYTSEFRFVALDLAT
jgi:Lantibiotic dehydratase, N terminus